MKAIFIVTRSFLRTKEKTDPFFDPIIRAIADREDIEWKVFLWEKGVECGYPKERLDDYHALEKCCIMLYRLFRLFAWRTPTWKLYRLAGRVVRPFFARKFAADIIITQAGMCADEFTGIVPSARVVDVQHGVIYSRHRGYFDSSARLMPGYQGMKQREFWLFGPGYADCFFKHPDNAADLAGRVHVIGDLLRASSSDSKTAGGEPRGQSPNLMVFSLQLTADSKPEELAASVKRMEDFFAGFIARFGNKYECLVKHHPRFNNVYDLSGFYARFPQIKETKAPWPELYPRMALHATFSSTVTFDCGSVGIPTVLLDLPNPDILDRDFFRYDYNYPYFGKSADEILAIPELERRETIISWYRHFYAPFDAAHARTLVRERGTVGKVRN
ncbi:MAG: hypothetical protein II909_01765 [Kiritimatiellae bacterium]|nr:hypothetical protein [Kiritimatiellia bacterium]